MLIVSEELCQKYDMINLHPAPPGGPTGSWQEVIWTLIQNKADTAGAMIHLVTPELDRGPALATASSLLRVNPSLNIGGGITKTCCFGLFASTNLLENFLLSS